MKSLSRPADAADADEDVALFEFCGDFLVGLLPKGSNFFKLGSIVEARSCYLRLLSACASASSLRLFLLLLLLLLQLLRFCMLLLLSVAGSASLLLPVSAILL